jgi:hypothetical protein
MRLQEVEDEKGVTTLVDLPLMDIQEIDGREERVHSRKILGQSDIG